MTTTSRSDADVVKGPPLPRRAVLGAMLAAASVGALVGLGILGKTEAPKSTDFRFSRGANFDIGQEQALRNFLAPIATDNRIHLLFTGHTSTDGDTSANIALANTRAEAAATIARDLGIAEARISTGAAGSAAPGPRPTGLSDREYQRSLARVTVSTQVVR